MRNTLLLIAFFTCLQLQAKDQTVKVGLFRGEKLYFSAIKVERGEYNLYVDGKWIFKLKTGERLNIRASDSVNVNCKGLAFKGRKIQLKGAEYLNYLSIKSPHKKSKLYDDNLNVTNGAKGLRMVNEVKLENYVASVVEGEAGYNLPAEFYKLQAILSRTYVLKNWDRHSHEGYNICDKVHCQVYHHRCSKSEIYHATIATKSIVVVDQDLKLINTIFSSNCGGETCNSENVWNTKLSYLRSVESDFCSHSSNAQWEKTFSAKKVRNYFKVYNNEINDSVLFNFCQTNNRIHQKNFYNVPLTKIRRNFKLRSTFFYLEDAGDSIRFVGRGYGHGVGLCQQGGIAMANQGYSYVDILKHYYKGIHILNRKALRFFLEDPPIDTLLQQPEGALQPIVTDSK